MAGVSVEEALRVLRDAVKTAKGRAAVDVLSGELGVETNTPSGGPYREPPGQAKAGVQSDAGANASAAGGRFAAAKDQARQSAGASSAKGDHSLPPFMRRMKRQAKGSATAQKGS